MRTIGAVTVGRSDFGIYLPIFRQIKKQAGLELVILASGMHLAPEFGLTVREIRENGFEVTHEVESLVSSDSPVGMAKSIGLGVSSFAQVFASWTPDILLVLGDRFEMYSAVVSALPFHIPVAHVHGGELSEGAIDNALRHSMTFMSHLHFVSTDTHAGRLRQLGEEEWRIMTVGAPALDKLKKFEAPTAAAFAREFEIPFASDSFLLVTYHPVTLEYAQVRDQTLELLSALEDCKMPVLFTRPNADAGGHLILKLIKEYVSRCEDAALVSNLGWRGFFTAMQLASAMVGNSSSALIEAPSFHLPAVNVGDRQAGRVRGANVIDCGNCREGIHSAILKAISPGFRVTLQASENPYFLGGAGERIAERLATVELDGRLLRKRFVDLDPGTSLG